VSGQIHDNFQYKSMEYSISAIEFPEQFLDIYSFGIEPKEFSTACWRGYVATYAINGMNLLVLDKLYTNNGNNENNKAPLINGKLPRISTPEGLVDNYKDFREYNYENIDFAIHYTGSIIITRNFIQKRYVNMGFQSPVNYRNVLQITFVDGKFVDSNNLSKIAASMRKGKLELAEKEIKETNVIKWIEDCFDLSYFRKENNLVCGKYC
jgi:hypothetical protein